MKKELIMIALLPLVVMTSSCAVFAPSRAEPVDAVAIQEVYRNGQDGVLVSNRWWEVFGDVQLNRLIEEALRGNFTLAQAEARLQQATALRVQAVSSLYPELSVEGVANVTKLDEPAVEGGEDTTESYSLGLAASYELDLWGRVRSTARAAALAARSSRADRDTAAMTVSAELVLTYFELLARRQGIDLLEEQLETSRETLKLIELRFRRSQVTALDVLQQRQEVVAVEQLLPALYAAERGLLDRLAVLVGRSPDGSMDIEGRVLPAIGAVPGTGLPADLLARRPDIESAWLKLRSAAWSRSAAQADRLPAIRLSGSGTYSSDAFGSLFDNWVLNLAAGLAAPVFDAGRRKAEVLRQEAIVDERLAAYRETVFEAIVDVQEALRLEQASAEELLLLGTQLELADAARKQALQRYMKGQENYLRVLTATDSRQRLEREVVIAKLERLTYRVQLYRALGGNWSQIFEEVKADVDESPNTEAVE